MKKRHIIFTVIAFILAFSNIYAQTNKKPTKPQQVKSLVGNEYWLCFEKNHVFVPQSSTSSRIDLELFIASDEDALVNIEIDGIGFKQQIQVPAGTMKNLKIPASAIVMNNQEPERLAVHLTSNKPVFVYGLNHLSSSTDSYLGIPTDYLGTEYRVICYAISDGLMAQFAIIATEDNTDVTIIPTVPTAKNNKHLEPFTVRLRKGDVYQVVPRFDTINNCDLTGSYIKSNKKIAVFSGHQCAYVPPRVIACNHLVEQIPPIPSWGKHFYLGRLQSRSNYSYRVLANENNTKIFEDGKLVRTLKSGQYYDSISNKNLQISADKPILVAQFSQGFNNGDSIGDPMMIIINPTKQFLQKYRFATPVNGNWEHYVNVVVPTKAIRSLRLDGNPIDPSLFQQLGISRYSIAHVPVSFGTHSLEGGLPFGICSYGFGFKSNAYDAYGTMGGQTFIEMEQVDDTEPPFAEELIANNKFNVVFRDDREDDTGMESVRIVAATNLQAKIPKIDPGTPQCAVEITPQIKDQTGSIILEALDVSSNKSIWTVCYAFNPEKNKYMLSLREGIQRDCEPDQGLQVGLFGKMSAIFHNANFSRSGNVSALGNFSDAFSFSGYAGLVVSRKFNMDFGLSAKIAIENIGGQLEAPDSIISHVRNDLGEIKPFQEKRILKMGSTFLSLSLSADYYLKSYLYLLGGLNLSLNISDGISLKRGIIIPDDYTYSDGSRIIDEPNAPSSLGSINTLRFGIFGGVGFTYSFTYRISAFTEAYYNFYFNDLIKDGIWKTHQLSLLIGLKYRFF